MLAANSTDVNNQAMMSLMQEAKNAMASNDTNANACNSVDVNQSACQYLAQKACCAQNSCQTSTQVMNVEVGCNPGIIKIRQDNNQKAEAACSIGVGQGASAKLDSKVKNKLAMDISQKAVGINPMAFFIIIAIIMI